MEEKKSGQELLSVESSLPLAKQNFSSFFSNKIKWFWIASSLVLLIAVGISAYFFLNVNVKKPKVYHVGVLTCVSYFDQISDGFKDKMSDLGYVEGKNIVYDIHRLPAEDSEEVTKILEGFVSEKVDLIVTAPTETSIIAKKIAKSVGIPVIFASAFTEGNSLIDNVRQPGGNITGVRFPSSAELGTRYLEVLHEIAPEAKRIWMPYRKDYPSIVEQIEAMNSVAQSLDMALLTPVYSINDIKAYLAEMENTGNISMDAIIGSPISSEDGYDVIVKFAQAHNLPLIDGNQDESIFVISPNPLKCGEQAARSADKVFKGVSVGTIPVASAENDFIINSKIIQGLGLGVPEGLLGQATKIIR